MSRDSSRPVPLRVQIVWTLAISVLVLGAPTAVYYGSWWIFIYSIAIAFVILLLGTIRRM
jgi:hypothetical protein